MIIFQISYMPYCDLFYYNNERNTYKQNYSSSFTFRYMSRYICFPVFVTSLYKFTFHISRTKFFIPNLYYVDQTTLLVIKSKYLYVLIHTICRKTLPRHRIRSFLSWDILSPGEKKLPSFSIRLYKKYCKRDIKIL